MKIPYGQCDFAEIRREGMFYADKTPFLPLMENIGWYGKFQLFLRPRRFGKSTLIHML
ncbi:MAG: AAA family ATPase, partial [Myxococcota bacterium]